MGKFWVAQEAANGTLLDELIIDGYTQPGATAPTPSIGLDGAAVGQARADTVSLFAGAEL